MNPSDQVAAEQALLREALGGDVSAFGCLAQRHFGVVFAVALARLRDFEVAEDLTQEVFLRAQLHLRSLGPNGNFGGWVVRIARNLAIDWQRRGQRASRLLPMVPLGERLPDVPDPKAKGVSDAMADREEIEALRRAILGLPAELREIILLHVSEEMTQEQIAERLGMHQATVSRRLQRAVNSLRNTLTPLLREAAPALRPAPSALAKTLAIAAAIGAMSATAKASLAAAAPASQISHATAAVQAGAAGAVGVVGFLQSLPALIAGGVKAMGTAKGIAAAAGAAAVIAGGGLYLSSGGSESTPRESASPGDDGFRRLHLDMRAVATALEAYKVDWNVYPPSILADPRSVNADDPLFSRMSGFQGPTLTTPVAHLTRLPIDPYSPTDQATFAYERFPPGDRWEDAFGTYALFSPGPDLDWDFQILSLYRGVRRVPEDTTDFALRHLYDPTNGTLSDGDIVLGQRFDGLRIGPARPRPAALPPMDDAVRTAYPYTSTLTWWRENGEMGTTRRMVLRPGRIREERADGVFIWDLENHPDQYLFIESNHATLTTLTEPSYPGDALTALPQLTAAAEEVVVGDDLDGRPTRHLRASDWDLWLDPDSGLPIRYEVRYENGAEAINGDFIYHANLDESLFALSAPPGMELMERGDISIVPTEQNLIDGLRAATVLTGGSFPPEISMDWLVGWAEELQPRIPSMTEAEHARIREAEPLVRQAIRFVQYVGMKEGEWEWQGTETQFGQSDVLATYWWPGMPTTHVIHGDLSIRDGEARAGTPSTSTP